jgi:hypothetical protein
MPPCRPTHRLILALLASLALAPFHLAAQQDYIDPIGPPDDGSGDGGGLTIGSETVPFEDPGSDVDPSLVDLSDSTLGEEVEPYDGEPELLSITEDPNDQGAIDDTRAPLLPVPAVRDCTKATTVTPIGVDNTIQHYFVLDGGPRVLAGVSADAGCHLYLPDNLKCRYGSVTGSTVSTEGKNFNLVLDDAKRRGINKIRVWVAMVNETVKENVPFLYRPAVGTTPGYWDLTQKNEEYFKRLLEVVNYAHARGMVIEVTFFAPYQGSSFVNGAWSQKTRNGSQIGFSREEAFVVANDPRLPAGDQAMFQYQKNVIQWTVERLWCYENLIWEIANEPTGLSQARIIGEPNAVVAWEKALIQSVLSAEGGRPSHAIAVQPFTTTELNQLTGANSPARVINGHYATVSAKTFPTYPAAGGIFDLGALDLIRKKSSRPFVFGFNETKITPFGGEGGTRSHLNGAVGTIQLGANEPARAEAIEFLFNQGGIYEHWGYLGKPGTTPAPPYDTSPMRAYMAKLLNFFNTRRFDLPFALTDYKTMSLRPDNVEWNSWFRPGDYAAWEPTSGSNKYWAALTTGTAISTRVLLYYVHHSTSRCKDGYDYAPIDAVKQGCMRRSSSGNEIQLGQFLLFNSYDARIWTQPGTKYQEHLTILSRGTYEVTWIDPETLQQFAGTTTQTVDCRNGCTLDSPAYKFDLLVKLVKR